MSTDNGVKRSTGQVVFWYTCFCAASVGMQLVNKGIALALKQSGAGKLDNAILAFQQIVAIVLNFIFAAVFPTSETWQMKPVTLAQVKRLVLPSVNFVFMLACSLKALKTVHVATVVVARNACTVFIGIGECIMLGQRFSAPTWVSLGTILLGSFVYASTDLNFEPTGYFWQGLNSVFFCIGQLYEKWAMGSTKDQTALGVSTIKNALSLPVLAGLVIGLHEYQALGDLLTLPAATHVLILLSGLGCCALSIVYMTLYKISTATAVTVGSNFNKVVTIICSAFIFAGSLGTSQLIGLMICIGGSLWYYVENMKAKKAASSKSA
eukprot:TRINITY_DN17314_c0_g1_i1.p1 TRINITY_DN17314_c0_g1~~TRINITY_DN17314_c0_g1_i1.p1  ORF type:complete len:323 (-),score=66.75 TRINITY_DN17314_c0_g1_i1:208-1176(-)